MHAYLLTQFCMDTRMYLHILSFLYGFMYTCTNIHVGMTLYLFICLCNIYAASICFYTYTYTCGYTYIHHTDKLNELKPTYAYVYTYMYLYTYRCILTSNYTSVHLRVLICINAFHVYASAHTSVLHMYLRRFIYVCIYIYICGYMCLYIYI